MVLIRGGRVKDFCRVCVTTPFAAAWILQVLKIVNSPVRNTVQNVLRRNCRSCFVKLIRQRLLSSK